MKKHIIIFLFGLIFNQIQAQHAQLDYVFTNVMFQNYTMKNGLSSNYCYDVLQDKKGYVWIATLNGLNRFNGNKWEVFQQQNANKKHRVASNWLVDIDEDFRGNIWVNTIKGISVYNPKSRSIKSFNQPIKGWGKILPVKEFIFVSSWTGIDLFRRSDKQLTLIKHFKETENNTINFLFQDSDNNLWACPEDKPSLIVINSKTKKINYYKKIVLNGKSQEIIVNSITQFSKDTLLLNTKSKGIVKYCIKDNKAFSFLDGILSNLDISCSALYDFNKQTMLIVGTKNEGLFSVDLKSKKIYSYQFDLNIPTSILSNTITSLFIDNNKGVWIGTNKGVSFFHPSLQKNKYFYFYSSPIIPKAALINYVEKINSDEYLIGTDSHGLFYYKVSDKRAEKIEINAGVSKIVSILKLSESDLLLGTNKGLFRYNLSTKKCKVQAAGNENLDVSILNLKKLSNDCIAICTNSGLLVWDSNKNSILYSELNKTVKLFCKDAFLAGDDLWILRFFDGYECYNFKTKKLRDFTPAGFKGKPINYYNFSTDSKNLFIATTSGIIAQNLKNKNRLQIIRSQQGLEGDIIENVCYVKQNELYYTTCVGLYSYNLKKHKSTRIVSYENYTQKWHNQLELQTDGSLVYTISDYFMVNNPFLNVKNEVPPSLEIEDFLINGESIQIEKQESGKLFFSNNENNLTIKFAGLVFPASEKNIWFYKLNLVNTKLKSTHTGEIELNNLPPNSYELSVYSINNEGLKSVYPKVIYFEVLKPFYTTWWFLIFILLLVSSVFYRFYRFKKNQLLRLSKIRSQISRDLHDELGANVSSINIMSKMLLQKNNLNDNSVLANISKYSIQISDTINDIIWNVNPKFDSIDELIKKMVRFASETLENSQMGYSIDIPPYSKLNIALDNEIKYHLYLIFKESINNALKYSQAKNITIKIDLSDNNFSFQIKDDGIGFNLNDSEKGNGLNNMKSRAHEIKAQINIVSEPKKGTAINLMVKLK